MRMPEEKPSSPPGDKPENPETPEEGYKEFQTSRSRSRVQRVAVFLILTVLILVGGQAGYLWWDHQRNFKITDNAYVQATIVPVSAQVPGVVSKLLVKDNQAVHAGDRLVHLDRRRFEVAVEISQAAVAVARARYESSKLSVIYSQGRGRALLDEAQARQGMLRKTLRSAQALLVQKRNETKAMAATLARTNKDLKRKKRLYRQGVISDENLTLIQAYQEVAKANYDASEAALQVEEEKVAALGQQSKEFKASVDLARNEGSSKQIKSLDSESLKAELEQAKANLKEAELLLSYTEIRAPVPGYVNKTVDLGTYVAAGRPLLVVVQLHKAYIRANFKEVQLEDIHVGQPVEITIDAFPGKTFKGHVDSVYSGTGDAFSLLPAENATGNWVKITRRVPVKIVLDDVPPPQYPLLVGMSAEVSVDVRDRSGPRLLAYPSRVQKNQPQIP